VQSVRLGAIEQEGCGCAARVHSLGIDMVWDGRGSTSGELVLYHHTSLRRGIGVRTVREQYICTLEVGVGSHTKAGFGVQTECRAVKISCGVPSLHLGELAVSTTIRIDLVRLISKIRIRFSCADADGLAWFLQVLVKLGRECPSICGSWEREPSRSACTSDRMCCYFRPMT
jgi:hypothetical protein